MLMRMSPRATSCSFLLNHINYRPPCLRQAAILSHLSLPKVTCTCLLASGLANIRLGWIGEMMVRDGCMESRCNMCRCWMVLGQGQVIFGQDNVHKHLGRKYSNEPIRKHPYFPVLSP